MNTKNKRFFLGISMMTLASLTTGNRVWAADLLAAHDGHDGKGVATMGGSALAVTAGGAALLKGMDMMESAKRLRGVPRAIGGLLLTSAGGVGVIGGLLGAVQGAEDPVKALLATAEFRTLAQHKGEQKARQVALDVLSGLSASELQQKHPDVFTQADLRAVSESLLKAQGPQNQTPESGGTEIEAGASSAR